MRNVSFGLLIIALLMPACVQPDPSTGPSSAKPSQGEAAAVPFNTTFNGKVPLAQVESLGHSRPGEDATWAVSQSGFLLNLSKDPAAMEVRLEWSAMKTGQYFIMLHSHKAHGTNVYVEHITNWTAQPKDCLRVPAKDLSHGTWQVMIHTRDVALSQYTLTVTSWGVQGKIEPDRHGHKPEDGAFTVDKHAIEPCSGLA